jgi:two-component system sensor histidine kinase UhpB
MRERALLIGADLTIGPARERGTEILLRVPLESDTAW